MLALAGGQTDDASITGAIVAMAEMPRDETCWLLALSHTRPDDTDNGTIEHAVSELAKSRGETYERTYEQVRALAGGERTRVALRTAVLDMASMRPSETVSLSVLSMAEKHALARTGQAMPGGDYPIPDIGHLRAAIVRFKEGKLAGHSRDQVRAHILKHAGRLGVEVSLDGKHSTGKSKVAASGALALTAPALSERTRFVLGALGSLAPPGEASEQLLKLSGMGAEPAQPVAKTYREQVRDAYPEVLALSRDANERDEDDDDETDAEWKIRDVISRHSNSDLFRQPERERQRGDIAVHDHGLTTGAEHPARSGKKIGTADRAHSGTSGFGGADAVVSRNPDLLSGSPRTGNRVTAPKSPSQRQAEETAALHHGRQQSRIHD